MANPTKGNIISAKESAPAAYDDILGKFRMELVRKVESSIQFHTGNAADPTKTVYRMGISDAVNPTPTDFTDLQVVDDIPHYFQKNGAKLTLSDVLAGNTTILPDDGQVPENKGDLIDGQKSFWDVQGGSGIGPGSEASSVTTSVAHAIAQHTGLLCRVRKGTIRERMATTKRKYNSKKYPKVFDGVEIAAKGDTLVTQEQWYTFVPQATKTGLTHFAEPFRSALQWQIFAQTVFGDPIREPRVDAGNQGGGPDKYGVGVSADGLVSVFERMKGVWEQAKEYNASVVLDYCHSSCHASCHSSRSRR